MSHQLAKADEQKLNKGTDPARNKLHAGRGGEHPVPQAGRKRRAHLHVPMVRQTRTEKNNMPKALLLSLMNLALAGMATAQNLVPNGSFEYTSNCYLPEGQYEFMLGMARPWFSPNNATPDVYTANTNAACGIPIGQEVGSLDPFNGIRYAGIAVYENSPVEGGTKEYLATPLATELVAGQVYHISFHLARSSFARYSVDTLGVFLSADSLHLDAYSRLSVVPQVRFSNGGHFSSTAWAEVTGQYVAEGGERYLYLGSFEEDSNMDCVYDPFWGGNDFAYYMVDKVEVTESGLTIGDPVASAGSTAYVHQSTLYWPGHKLARCKVMDLGGRWVSNRNHALDLDVGYLLPDDLAPGLYLVQVTDGKDPQVVRWFKE